MRESANGGRESASSLGGRLRAAREAAGLSARALAVRMGVGHATVREAEAGRDPRLATLALFVAHLPGLDASHLMGLEAPVLPPVDAAWRFHRDHQGFVIGRLTFSRRPAGEGLVLLGLEATRVRSLQGSLAEGDRRAGLWRTILRGSSAALARVEAHADDLEGRVQIVVDGQWRHELWMDTSGLHPALSYRRTGTVPVDGDVGVPAGWTDGLGVLIDHPVERLELRSSRTTLAADVPRWAAWPAPLLLDEAWMDVSWRHGRGARFAASAGAASLVVARPLIGLRVAVGWSAQAGSPTVPARSGRAPRPARGAAGLALRAARERAGLGQRELARRLGVAAGTVSAAEQGRDLRLGLARACLQELPDLAPMELLGLRVPSRACTAEEVWWLLRELHGCEVETETKILTLEVNGDSSLAIGTRGLRALRPLAAPLRVRLGLGRAVLQVSRAQLRELEMTGRAAREIRITSPPTPGAQSLVTIPAPLAARGVSFARRLLHPGVYTMTEARARRLVGEDVQGPFVEGTSFAALLPVRTLRLVVRYPAGYWPRKLETHCWPVGHVPTPDQPDVADLLHPEGLRLNVRRDEGRVELVVQHPLVGFKYGIGWELP